MGPTRIDRRHPAAFATRGGGRAGLGGVIRRVPEDFLVEELPIFSPSGHGDHTIALIEKRATATFDALLFLSKACKVSERVIGYAGLKDAQAVARQYVSLPKIPPKRALAVSHRKLRVLSAERNEKPLRIGYLRGNRFTIRIREADLSRVDAAREVLALLARHGMPNGYGSQRFGVRQDGHLLGLAVLRQDWKGLQDQFLGRPNPLEKNPQIVLAREAYDAGRVQEAYDLFPRKHRSEKKGLGVVLRGGSPRQVYESVGSGPRRIWLSAWQSYLFNRILDERVREGTLDALLEGDIAWLHESGALYPVRDAEAERTRAESGEASPTGPLIGNVLFPVGGRPAEIETAILEEEGTRREDFLAGPARSRGLRRALRCPVREAALEVEADGAVVVRFALPPGAFATVLLEHLMSGPGAEGQPKVTSPQAMAAASPREGRPSAGPRPPGV